MENLEILRDWPSNNDIKGAINYAYEQASALAKDILGMVLNTKIRSFITIIKESEPKIRNKTENQLIDSHEFNSSQESSSSQSNNIFISAAATEIEEEDCFADGCSQLTFILDSTRRSHNCNIEDDASIGITNKKLKISVLVNQRRSHEAYTNQRMERKVAALSASGPNYRFNNSLVLFLSSNEYACPGIPCQNRWKIRARLERLNDG
ncbi:15902_t:CDS:2, partial [Cetraspora pellucida]